MLQALPILVGGMVWLIVAFIIQTGSKNKVWKDYPGAYDNDDFRPCPDLLSCCPVWRLIVLPNSCASGPQHRASHGWQRMPGCTVVAAVEAPCLRHEAEECGRCLQTSSPHGWAVFAVSELRS
jgi:hypothetical protein